MYPMLRLRDYGLGVKALVNALEQSVIDLLSEAEVVAQRRPDAPGVYVDDAKIAALGLRIRRGTSYHGLSLNVKMDLQPFSNIDPCGYQGLQVTQMADYLPEPEPDIEAVSAQLLKHFVKQI
jgi:lipoyl(octanoyl) transferase